MKQNEIKEQNAISRKYNLRTREFGVILHNLTLIRNVCAHDEKLYDIKMKNRIFSTNYHKKLQIENVKGNYQFATRDLFSVIISLKMILEKENFNEFYSNIIQLIHKLDSQLLVINIDKILNMMGFPTDYKKLLDLE